MPLFIDPIMSENRKDELNTQLSKLTADRDVLRWKALHPNSPTIENYETQEKYVTNEKNFSLDDIVNGIGNGSLVEGTDEWYKAHKKVSDFDNQLRALSMGKMGQLDGERAVPSTMDEKPDILGAGTYHLNDDNDSAEHEQGGASGYGGGGGGAGGSWGNEGDNKTSITKAQEGSLKVLVDAPGYDNDEDDSEATEIVIDFTNPEYELVRGQYSFWKDGHTIAKDLACYIMENYPVIAEKWGYDRLANEIDLHYKLYRLGYKPERTAVCNISNSNDTSWEFVNSFTQFENALGKDFELPK